MTSDVQQTQLGNHIQAKSIPSDVNLVDMQRRLQAHRGKDDPVLKFLNDFLGLGLIDFPPSPTPFTLLRGASLVAL